MFHHDGWAPETADVEDTATDFLTASYGRFLPDGQRHPPVVAAKLARLHAEEPTLGASDLQRVTSRTLVLVGDDEVTLEYAVALYRGLPDAELAVVPGTPTRCWVEKPAPSNTILVDFLTLDPMPTLAPIRRAT